MKIAYVVIGFVVVAAAVWAAAGLRDDANSPQYADESQGAELVGAAQTSEMQEFTGSMKDLLARSGSWQCDVAMMTQGIASNGTVYISNGRIRGDFTSNVPHIGNVQSHMIAHDDTVYTWTSLMNQGFAFPMQDGEVQASGANADAAAQFNQDYTYSCRTWSPDESHFALPSHITF